MKEQLRKWGSKLDFLEKIEQVKYLIILLAAILICLPLTQKKIDMFQDDGVQHIARLMGTYQSIQEKQFFPVIMSQFCNGFGYSWNLFYSPFTAYAPLVFKFFSISFTDCIKLFMFAMFFLSGITMYQFLKKITKSSNIALLGSILYLFLPYRMTDMYIRNALAELVSFAFLPLIFHGLYEILEEGKRGYRLAVGAIFLILTHTIVTFYTAIFAFVYLLCYSKKLKEKETWKNLLKNTFFIITITSFFWVPLLQSKLQTNYEVFLPGRMEREEVLVYYKLKLYQLFYTPKEQIMIFELGWVTIIGLLFTPLVYRKLQKPLKKIYTIFGIVGSICLIMTLAIFPFEKLPGIFTMIQFTFRLLEFIGFFFCCIAAINYSMIIKNFKIKDVFVISIITFLLLVPYTNKLKYKENYQEEILWPSVPVTENTGRVHAGLASFEYLPSKAFQQKDYLIHRSDEIILVEGTASIKETRKEGTTLSFTIGEMKSDITAELPYIYYIGYEAITSNGEKLMISESENGFIQVMIPKQENAITVKLCYTGTALMKITIFLSFMGIVLWIILIYKEKRKK